MYSSWTMAAMGGPWGRRKGSSPRVDAVRDGGSEVEAGSVEVSTGVGVVYAAGR